MSMQSQPFRYELLATDGLARRGRIHTAHGTIETPAFMPVGTVGSVKGLRMEEVRAMGADIILGNTYHLFLRPGHELIQQLGGLHKFIQWPHPILTDSAGFQIYSLGHINTVSEEGCTFKSHLDGQTKFISPEISTQVQHAFGSTITMAFDECTKKEISFAEAKRSWELTYRWAKRSRNTFVQRPGYAQYGIVQGAHYEDLRRESADKLMELGFEGFAIGGYLFEESNDDGQMFEDVVGFTASLLPQDKPRYVMGAGYPSDIIRAVKLGVDQFDCVLPTRNARNGQAFTSEGVVSIKRAEHRESTLPLDPACQCKTCTGGYTRAYLHHLFKAEELLGHILMTQHNIFFYLNMMKELRAAIEAGTLNEVSARMLKTYR
ncbi:MAG: tRNA guanosine(34) transglycosylase Tgt [Alphaproteobacteria bacterium]